METLQDPSCFTPQRRRCTMSLLLNVAVVMLACTTFTQTSMAPEAMNSIALQWNFDDGRNGWGQSSSLEMGVEIDVGGGQLRGVVLKSGDHKLAFVDSPELHAYIGADKRDHLVFRMRFLGQCDLAMVSLQRSPSEPTVWLDADRRVMNDPIRIPFKLHSVLEQDDLYFIPIWKHVTGVLRRVRFYPCVSRNTITGHSFSIDWIAFTKAPIVTKVRGCIDKYFDDDDEVTGVSGSDKAAHLNCTETERWTNGFHPSVAAKCLPMTLPRASTYNCAREGGELVSISGKHFGTADAVVSIDGVECLDVVHVVPEVELQCRLPPAASNWLKNPTYPSVVRVHNGRLLRLFDEIPLLSYAAPVSSPTEPIISNVASHAIDVNWNAPTDVWESMTVTGYRVAWKRCADDSFSLDQSVVVGNVTSTTLIELESSTSYQAKVTPLTENQWRWSKEWRDLDLYGRRQILPNAVLGFDSPLSSCVQTLRQDFVFPQFNARLLTNLSALPEAIALRTAPTLGPTGEVGDQGHFGLHLNGDAHVQNCNASVSCCDNFDTSAPRGSSGAIAECSYVCFKSEIRSAISTNGLTLRSLPSNAMTDVPVPAKQVYVFDKSTLHQPVDAAPITAACGTVLRITASQSFLTGAAWYPRQMNVREGFTTSFSFRVTNPSTICRVMDKVHTNCRLRGGDGFAFVIHNDVQQELALGSGGMSLGYGGLRNALVIEFDTWFNPELLDVYENHISVHVSGNEGVVLPNHTHSLGATSNIPDLTEDIHAVRITYNPNLDESMLFDEPFTATTLAGNFFSTSAWRSGVGLLSIYLDDMNTPVLTVPLRIENTLELFHGRAWVGFTGATGANAWQTLDILSWDFDSLRHNITKHCAS
ncbi:Bacterial lectin [Phytophthora infestans]|uniref:Bacterial lectin n=1 Tax=Phytophthora infestans TaxID=4787 RepID=A0A8S9TSS7_PHYIN|nr:Bacterial lectin [Phytophthora infestans]